MDEYSVRSTEITEKMGFEELDHSVRAEIYKEFCNILENEFKKSRVKKFGSSDIFPIMDQTCEPWEGDVYAYVLSLDGKLVQIRLTYCEIILTGRKKTCQNMVDGILKFAKKTPKEKILPAIEHKLDPHKKGVLAKWKLQQ